MQKLRKVVSRMMLPLRLYQHRNMFREFPTCFVVSTGRTGTKYIEYFFNRFAPETFVVHEPSPDLFDLGMNQYRLMMSPGHVARQLRKSRLYILREVARQSKTIYLESNNNASLLIPAVKTVFPSCRIIWITRHIKTFLPSAFSKSPDGSGKVFFYAKNDHRNRLTPHDVPGDPWQDQWGGFSRVERIAWWWQKCNQLLIDNAQGDSRCLHIRFEDLFDGERGLDVIQRVFAFLKLPWKDRIDPEHMKSALTNRVNQTRRPLIDSFDELATDEKGRIGDIVAMVAKKLGYSMG